MRLLLPVVILLILVGCNTPTNPSDVVSRTALEYYNALIRGDYSQYVDGFYQRDSIPPTYREQLLVNAKMFYFQQLEEHRGIVKANILRTDIDKSQQKANVFLRITYGDSTNEQIVIPMMKVKEVWYMR